MSLRRTSWSTSLTTDVPTPVTDGKYFYVVNDRDYDVVSGRSDGCGTLWSTTLQAWIV